MDKNNRKKEARNRQYHSTQAAENTYKYAEFFFPPPERTK